MRRLLGLFTALLLGSAATTAAEYNPINTHPVSIGPEMHRVIVGFRATTNNSVVQTIKSRVTAQSVKVTVAKTTAADVSSLASRIGLSMAKSRQLTPNMHVVYLKQTLYGADVLTALAKLRADSTVEFADVDKIRYPLTSTIPNDPLYVATSGATGQWYMQAPSSSTGDLSATDATDAWTYTKGSTGTVIADVDTGVRFDHPDLLRAGLGGRLLPGYDFVGEDYDPNTGNALGTYLVANDGDGWDPDPSDPGDWISSSDQQNSLFPSSSCSTQDSSWHGTRVMGILGALTNNDVGIAGMTWSSWILPVRALGKCGGYDSDIIAGIEWAAGLSVGNSVPDNPYPANIINLSLGGSGSCPTSYQSALATVTGMGVLVVASAGNASGSVETPANCSASVSGIIAVAGLRNVGTKVGYSSFGPEVGVSAPAGNCINSTGACLRSIDTTTNLGTTVPGTNSYTDQTNYNLGTSFSAPIVSGIAGLMRAVNGNLTPALLVKRLESSASAFPANTSSLPVCPNLDSTSDECSCPASGECGTGMVNAESAVIAALNPIAAVSFPSSYTASSQVTFNASASAAACGRTIASYAWTAGSGVTLVSGANSSSAVASGTGTLTLTVTDSQGATDTATITLGSTSATSTAPTSTGSSACVTAISVNPTAPTLTQAFSPTSVGVTIASTLKITLQNANAFDLTQTSLSTSLASGLSIASSPAAATTCTGASKALTASGSTVSLSNAVIPANGSCTITLAVSSTTAGTYTNTIAAGALSTGPAGSNTAASSATLTVTAPIAPTITQSFASSSVSVSTQSTLTITVGNTNTYALTQAALSDTLPSGLTIATSPAASTTCGGSLSATSGVVTLSSATLPASGSCTITVIVSASSAGTYTNTIAAGALTDSQSATNAASSGTLTVNASSGGGGGSLGWLELLAATGALYTRRRLHAVTLGWRAGAAEKD